MIKEKLYIIMNCGGQAVCAFTTKEEAKAFVDKYGSSDNFIYSLTTVSINVFEKCEDYEDQKRMIEQEV